MATPDTELDEIRELLPWYLNGTLDPAEAERVQRYIDEMQTEADETDALLKTLGEDVPVPMLTHERIAGVMSKIDAEPRPAGSVLARVRQWWRSLPQRVDYRIPATVAAALALVAVLVMNPRTGQDGDYQTYTSERPPVEIQVEMAADVDAAEMRALFEAHGAAVQRQGDDVFVITLPEDTSVAELYATLEALRADARVRDARALTGEE